jgi:flagellar hook-basal body protein
VYDSVGAKHELRYYYRRENGLAVNQWAMYTYLDDYALKLDSGGQWSAAAPELDPSTGEPRRDVRGAIVQSIYEPGSLSNISVGDRLNLGVDSSSLIQDGVTLSSGLAIKDVKVGDGASVGTSTLQVKPDGVTLTLTYNGRVYVADAPLGDFAQNGEQTLAFTNGDQKLATFTLKSNAGAINGATAASQLTTSPQTSSLSFSGLTLTSVNFGETAAAGNLYRIVTATGTPDSLGLEVSSDSGNTWTDTGATAFVGNDLAAGAKTSFAFTVASTNATIMTVNLKNPTNSLIPSTTSGTVTGLQQLLITGGGILKDQPPRFEAKLASVRRPQAVRYIFEVDPTTGTMLDTLENPVAKIFQSLPNGEPDKASGVNGIIPKLSPSFKYTVKLGADVSTIVEGVPFGGTHALLNFEISEWEGTSVNSANSQTKSVQTGGRSLSRLTGLTIDPGGRMVASYSNGDITYGSRLALALVPAENGLIPVGANLYQESYFSGQSTIGNPGDPGFGTIRSETVEDSNLDLAQELVKLTQLQRIYQANAKTISSADELLKTLLQI